MWSNMEVEQYGQDMGSLLGEIDSTTRRLDIDPADRMTAKDYVNVDFNVETEQSLTDDQIVELVSGETNDAESDDEVELDVSEEPPPPPPTKSEAHIACQILISFYESEAAKDDSFSSKLTEIRRHLLFINEKQVIRVKKLVGLPPPALELLASSSVNKRILCACTHTHTTH